MRLVTYDRGDQGRAGLAVGDFIADLEKAGRALGKIKLPASVRELLAAGEPALRTAATTEKKVKELVDDIQVGTARRPAWLIPDEDVHLKPPVPDPEKVICLGLNYMDHIEEQKGILKKEIEKPQTPMIFAKFASTLTGPYDPIVLPPASVTKQVDNEVELAVVIGKTTRGVSAQDAMAHVAGYMVMNDVSARDCQFSDKQWVRGKSFDTFAPCGPALVTADEIPDPHKLRLWCVLSGRTMQDSSTRHLIFKIPKIISFISQAITLKPGDIIATGTPAGVGIFRQPPVLVKAGDVAECGIEGIGTICNDYVRGK